MSKWIPVWHYVSPDYNQDIAVFQNVTQRALFTNNLRGNKVRLRFANLYSNQRMIMEHIAVQTCNRVTGTRSARIEVTCNGSRQIEVEPGGQPYSDEVELPVTSDDDLLVWQYFGRKTILRSVCTTSTWQSWQSTQYIGDFYKTEALDFAIKAQLAPALAAEPTPNQFVVGLSEVSVYTDDEVKLVGLFGDSITQMSYFSDNLIEQLYHKYPGKYSVINAGIAGNRIQKNFPDVQNLPGGGHQFGIAGRDRFLQDLYDGMTPDIVFLMEGVNDCSHSLAFGEPDVPTATDIYQALVQVATMARDRGSQVMIGTVSPFGAFGTPWRRRAEELRCDYNELIRTGTIADKIVDLDAVMRDPDDSHQMRANLHLGDGVHPNWKGGARMASEVLKALEELE